MEMHWEEEAPMSGICIGTYRVYRLELKLVYRPCCPGCELKTVIYEYHFDAKSRRPVLARRLREEISRTTTCGAGGVETGELRWNPDDTQEMIDLPKDQCHM